MVPNGDAWHAAVHWITKSRTWLHGWTITMFFIYIFFLEFYWMLFPFRLKDFLFFSFVYCWGIDKNFFLFFFCFNLKIYFKFLIIFFFNRVAIFQFRFLIFIHLDYILFHFVNILWYILWSLCPLYSALLELFLLIIIWLDNESSLAIYIHV